MRYLFTFPILYQYRAMFKNRITSASLAVPLSVSLIVSVGVLIYLSLKQG